MKQREEINDLRNDFVKSLNQKKEQLNSLVEQVRKLRTEIHEKQSTVSFAAPQEKEQLLDFLTNLYTRLEAVESNIETVKPEIETLNQKVAQCDRQLAEVEQKLDDLIPQAVKDFQKRKKLTVENAFLIDQIKTLTQSINKLHGYQKELRRAYKKAMLGKFLPLIIVIILSALMLTAGILEENANGTIITFWISIPLTIFLITRLFKHPEFDNIKRQLNFFQENANFKTVKNELEQRIQKFETELNENKNRLKAVEEELSLLNEQSEI
ncbi:MAG: hypothetical protein IJX98_01420 [Clostridia bacterium]|nr:hypothetical protein [Clostridia bacterium]